MLYTLKHVRDLVAPFVMTGGSCPAQQIVTDRINEAQRRLLAEGRADWDSTQRHVKLCTVNSCIALPREFESARLVRIDDQPSLIFPNSYQYLENGPGVECCGHYGKDLEDVGDGWPTFFEMPCTDGVDYYLFAASTDIADTKLSITAYGRKKDGSEIIRNTGLPGFDLSIRHWAGGVEGSLAGYPEVSSDIVINSLTQIVLPTGRKGYVTFYAVDPATHKMFFLSKYHPAESHPSYRRYRIRGQGCDESCVIVLAKLRHVPISRDDDVLLIQNMDAIKTMVMAIREENAGNVSAGMALEEKANIQLSRQLANKRSGDPIIQMQDSFAVGGFANMI